MIYWDNPRSNVCNYIVESGMYRLYVKEQSTFQIISDHTSYKI